MTDDAKQAAWRRYCEQLEALGVDPYSPDVPADDPRHEQVQAICAEHEAATTVKPALPPDWEGHPPTEDVATLPGLANWLGFQWSLIKGWELAGDEAKPGALRDAAKAIRNAFRVLIWLGVDDRPERPLPPDTLEEAKRQIDQLQRWVREKHKSGWKPTKKAKAVAAKPRPQPGKRRDAVPDDEADFLTKRFLKQNPDATAREVAEEIGVALGRVSSLPSWKRVVAERKAKKKPSKKSERMLTPEMLASIGKPADPVEEVIQSEAVWQWLLDKASGAERAKLHQMSEADQEALVQMTLEQFGDELPPELRSLE